MALIIFEGGPLDQHAYETETLLGQEALNLPIDEYNWTSEKKTSETSGAVAQVWRHKTLAAGLPAPVAPTTRKDATAELRTAAAEATTAAAETAAATIAPPPLPGNNGQPTTAASEAPAPAAQATAEVAEGTDLSGQALRARREAIKPRVSRDQIAKLAGLTVSKVFGIENESAKKITDEDRRKLAAAIATAEGDAGGRA